MGTKGRTIEVAPGSELARLLEDPAGLPIDLVMDGLHYRLDFADASARQRSERQLVEEDQDPLDKVIGSWANVDVDRLKEELRRAREEGSSPVDRHRPLT